MTAYIPADYWTKRGRTYESEAIKRGWWDVENEPLFTVLDTLEFASVLEVGCGFGRVGAALLRHYPEIAYTGIDVSPDMIESAKKRIPSGELICADLATWDTERTWDVVVSVSVLGHILPADIEQVIVKMRRWAGKGLVSIDWDEPGASTDFQYGHDYIRVYGDGLKSMTPYGRQSMFYLDRP